MVIYANREPLAMWRDAVRDACPITVPVDGPWCVRVAFRKARPAGHYAKDGTVLPRFVNATPDRRPDIDKLARAVLDALTMRVWRDDGQVIELHASKRYAYTSGATVTVCHA